MGARPLARVIQEYIKKPLADEVLFGKLKKGGIVKVSLVKDDDGAGSLKLVAIEDQPVKPVKAASPVDRKPKKPRKPKAAKSEPPKRSGPGGQSSTGLVPKVPLKT